MKALRFLRALPLALLLIAPASAEQGTIVGPTAGPKTMTEVMTTLNAALLAIQSCNSGSSAPANGIGGLPTNNECWADTTANPIVYKRYDGGSWVAFGKLNTSTHVWTPVYQGTDLGTASTATTGTSGHTLGFLDGANTWSAVQSFNSSMLSLKGSASGAGTLNAPAAASTYVWTLPPATDTLVGKATTDTFTNKTFDTAGTGNSFSINGLATTANTGTGAVARATSPTFVTPALGAATATSFNGNIWTAGTGTLTLSAGKTATVSNTLTLTGTDGSTAAFGAGGTVAYLANTLNAFASTTSAQLALVISDETGSGALVFGTSPTLTTPTIGAATATSLNKLIFTAPATSATLTIPDGVTLTGPAASGTAMTLGNTETVTGVKTFGGPAAVGRLKLAGTTSGSTTLDASATASGTLTLPAATDTLIGKATTDVLTNKAFDTAGAGNSLSINGMSATANTGTGAVVRATSPAITTPTGIVKGDVGLGNVDNTSDINKPVSTAQAAADALKVNLTRNVLTGCGLAGGGDLSADRTLRISFAVNAQTGTSYTVLDGDCGKLVRLTNAASVAVSLPQANGSTFVSGWTVDFQNTGAGVATITPATSTINGGSNLVLTTGQGAHCDSDGANYTCVLGAGAGGGGGVTSIVAGTGLDGGTITSSGTISLSAARRTLPTTQVFTSGSGTYTSPANVLWVEVFLQGGGGGGGGGANNGIAPSGTATCWNTTGSACTSPVYSAGGGTGGTATNPGTSTPGGTISGSGTCVVGIAGGDGGGGLFSVTSVNGASGGAGGVSHYGGGGAGLYAAAGSAAKTNSGSGGGGGGASAAASSNTGSGGAAGGYCFSIIGTPGATYTYTVGTGGSGATAGTNGSAGGNGAAGRITVIEHYGT